MNHAKGRPSAQGRVRRDSWRPAGVDGLEPAAWDALRHQGNSAVTAGPGAGKTEFLAQRAAFLLETNECPAPRRILAISYKRDSAANLSRRVAARVPAHADRFVSMTFDAFTKGLVDRFAQSLPQSWRFGEGGYEIDHWYERVARDFLTDLVSTAPAHMRAELYSLPAGRFLPDVVGGWPLPVDPAQEPATALEYAVWSWWQEQFLRPNVPSVDFTMLNRLADLIVRDNPQLLQALRATYPFVFVDEFQDTTTAQITFLHNVFGHAGVTTTVVGDGKQRIMRFAGALEDAMTRYQQDFGATRFELTWNFRSSEELVAAQRHFAKKLDPAVASVVSKAETEDGHVPLAIWVFPNPAREAELVAEWIAADIAASGRGPADFALVARQKVGEIEPGFVRALGKHGISVRNDDTMYGKLRLQDLLKHDVARLLLGTLTLAASRLGQASVWVDTHALLCRMNGVDQNDAPASRRVADQLGSFVSDLAGWLIVTEPTSTTSEDVVQRVAEVVDVDALAADVRSQHAGDSVELVLDALDARLKKVTTAGKTWAQVFADVAASNAVTLMSIHRSKGLEYHTVVMLGLDDQQWWSYAKDAGEARSTFFVGLSRAAQRVVFTATNKRGRSSEIREFYDLLDEAGAIETHWE